MKKLFLIVMLSACAVLVADVKLPAIFSHHAVLQKSSATAVFGTADPGEKVTVSYSGVSAACTADKNGRWLVRLDLSKCGKSGAPLVVEGKNRVVSEDVIAGDVWLCAGQSNMRFTVQRVLNAKKEMASSKNDSIRNFIVKNPIPFADGEGGKRSALFAVGTWQKASPEKVGEFSAVGYFFAREINAATGNAVGLIDPSIGASSIESWISSETLLGKLSKEVAKESAERIESYRNYDKFCAEHIKKLRKWELECGRADISEPKEVPKNADWQKISKISGKHSGGGVIWFRQKGVIRKEDIVDKSIRFKMGYPKAAATLFIDGKAAGSFSAESAAAGVEFKISVPEEIASVGAHEFCLRFHTSAKSFSLSSAFTMGKSRLSGGKWEMFREVQYPPLSAEQLKRRPADIGAKVYPQTLPARIFDRKLHPIFPCTLKGVLWYQGENNADKTAVLYAEMLTALVGELRKNFCNPELPFYAVQLTSFRAKSNDVDKTGYWPVVRAQQSAALMNIRNAHEAVILDLGESEDIHPICKQEVGRRLAKAALAETYKFADIKWKFPRAASAKVSGSAVTVTFADTYGKLRAEKLLPYHWVNRTSNLTAKLTPNSPDSEVEGFALCDKNGKWHWANAKIAGNTVIVSSPLVPAPTAIRYAWQDNPNCNLVNQQNNPAHPFFIKLK